MTQQEYKYVSEMKESVAVHVLSSSTNRRNAKVGKAHFLKKTGFNSAIMVAKMCVIVVLVFILNVT